MDIHITQKKIKDLCGTISFKKGQTFYQSGKVDIEEMTPEYCMASVSSTENFRVHIEQQGANSFKATCSCPSLGDFRKSCQHVAAVLIAINEQQKKEHTSKLSQLDQSEIAIHENQFLSIFHKADVRNSGHQHHFEKRQLLPVHFILTPIELTPGELLFAVQLQIAGTNVQTIRDFLTSIKQGQGYRLSQHLYYHPQQHCFSIDDDALLQQLLFVMRDEAFYIEGASQQTFDSLQENQLLIPPSAWKRISPFISKGQRISLFYNNQIISNIKYLDVTPPLHFYVKQNEKGYAMQVQGLANAIVLSNYQIVLVNGNLYELSQQSTTRCLIGWGTHVEGNDRVDWESQRILWELERE